MDKVVILTKAKPFQKEEFVDVFSDVKAVEKYLRKEVSPFVKKDSPETFHVDDKEKGETTLFFARTTEVKK